MDAEDQKFEVALAAWIDERASSIANPESMTRDEAIRRLAAEALKTMGLFSPRAE